MQSKGEYRQEYGTFLQMCVYHTAHNKIECGPDYIRLKNRFEVLNGRHESTNMNIEMRAMSYAMMLGGQSDVLSLIDRKQWPIKPTAWY